MDTEHLPPVSKDPTNDEDRVPIHIPRKRYREIEQSVLDLYDSADIHTIPFDVLRVASTLGIELVPYVTLSRETQQWARRVSKDAYLVWNTDGTPAAIFYNSKMPPLRLKFTIMHELAHACRGHRQHSQLAEIEANVFAAAALCPLPLIEKYGIEDEQTLARVFEISANCAERRWRQYQRWRSIPPFSRNLTFGLAVCTRFHLRVPYQPSLLPSLESAGRKSS